MRMDDPARPQIAGRPALSRECIIPYFYVMPVSPSRVSLRAMLPVVPGEFESREIEVRAGRVIEIMMEYFLDPELVLMQLFNWTPPSPSVGRRESNITLADLGL